MARQFTSPILLPAAPSTGLHAATKQYVDDGDAALTSAVAGKQPLDTDLTAIAALTATTDSFMVGVASAWAARTPTQVKATLAITESDVASLVTDLAAKVAGTRAVTAGVGLTGGGDLTADRTFVVSYGTSSTTACVGNDSRLSDSRAPNGTAGGVLSGSYPNPTLDLVTSTPYTQTFSTTPTIDPTLGNNPNLTMTSNITSLTVSTTGALDGQMILLSVLSSGGTSVTLAAATKLTTGLSSVNTIAAAKVGFFGFRYSSLLSAWVLLSFTASL